MKDFDFNSKYVKAAFWIIVIVVFVYLYLLVEPRHNRCWDEGRNDCNLDKFKIDPRDGDTNADLLQRLEGYTQLDQEKVFWRRSILNAIIASSVLLMLYHRKIPPPIAPFITLTLIIFIAFYFHNSYYMMHFDLRSNNFALKTINELRYRLGVAERPGSSEWTNMY